MMPVRLGDRGPAVEDIQRRLLALGYDLGPTGVDGVFLGQTAQAVTSFQARMGIDEDAVVGEHTWAALVDETFTPGDRLLFLRVPLFHGRDVRALQEALSVLGFACGEPDGIFGAFTERATREFQRNAGLVADGIAGDETFGAVRALRHVWEGKDPRSHSAAAGAAARSPDVLARAPFMLRGLDGIGHELARRVENLAFATSEKSRVRALAVSEEPSPGTGVVLEIRESGTVCAVPGRPVVEFVDDDTLASRLVTAVRMSRETPPCALMGVDAAVVVDEHDAQRAAVRLLDALCAAFG